jgi:protein associated with RNAse G/E
MRWVDQIRVVFGKWGGRPHWEYDALLLGDDEHGTWIGLPPGTLVARPGAQIRTAEPQVVLVPPARGFVATYYAHGGSAPCEVYVDISTVPEIGEQRVHAVDLDLDVLLGWTGRVWVDDEDEFADHRVRYGYPKEVVDLAVSTCAEVWRTLDRRETPFDLATHRGWLDVLGKA